jgi:replicative DNA helicase
MSQQITKNVLCSHAMVEAHKLRGGRFSTTPSTPLTEAAGPLYDAPLFVDDTPGLSTTSLRAKARRLKQKYDIGLIVIDYLQLMEAIGASKNVDSRQQEISYISRSLKGIARELSVPVIALSQLNRAADSREDHTPRLSDLRESGAIGRMNVIASCIASTTTRRRRATAARGSRHRKQRNRPTDGSGCVPRPSRFDNLALGSGPV